jgi:hypothetical protein
MLSACPPPFTATRSCSTSRSRPPRGSPPTGESDLADLDIDVDHDEKPAAA